jgi:hypothetical protein
MYLGTTGAKALFPPTIAAFDPRKLYSTVNQYSLTIEKQLRYSTVLVVSYVGKAAFHLDQTPNINQAQPNAAVAVGTVNVNTVRPYLGYAAINYDVRSASASYNGLQVGARRRFKNGFLFELAYTYSGSLGAQVGQSQIFNEYGVTATTERRCSRPIMFTICLSFAINTALRHTHLEVGKSAGFQRFKADFPLRLLSRPIALEWVIQASGQRDRPHYL